MAEAGQGRMVGLGFRVQGLGFRLGVGPRAYRDYIGMTEKKLFSI